uniref:Reverse transcriptase domain-containing protein n=1 Tax=Bracon brevicornis TaxID=1563983 RepID=A0A6V7LWZ3_9HYME
MDILDAEGKDSHSQLRSDRGQGRRRQGLSAGGVLSPLLWVLVVNELLKGLHELGLTAVGYADDVAIIASSDHMGTLHSKMQRVLDYVEEWCISRGLRVNPSETEMILFTRKRKRVLTAPSIFGTTQSLTQEIKYLGVWLDPKVLWNKHIQEQAPKGTCTFWACRRMFNSTWGLSPRVVLWIYRAIITPQLNYAAVVWWTSMRKASNRKAYDRVYRLVTLGITGAVKTTPTLALSALTLIPPPHATVKAEAVGAALRLRDQGHWRGSKAGHTAILEGDEHSINEVIAPEGDRTTKSFHFRRDFSISFPTREDWLEKREEIMKPKGLVWYTDGAKVEDGRAGIGV